MRQKIYSVISKKRYITKLFWIVKILIALIINRFSNKYKQMYSSCWIIGTGEDRYANNVKVFYEYLKERKPEITVYWVTARPERIPITDEMIIKRGSVKNYLIALNASVGLYSHSDADIGPGIYRLIKKRKTKIVMLDHGQSGLKRLPYGFWNSLVYDVMCCFSQYDKEVKVELGVPENKVFLTGYAHSDTYNVVADDRPIHKILIMPTWRSYYMNGDRNFYNTLLYSKYKDVFSDEAFRSCCDNNNVEVFFMLHPTFGNYFHCDSEDLSKKYGGWVNVITNSGDMHEQITSSDMFITDYSSLMWDFIYMNKPTLIYGFDWEEYNKRIGIRLTKEKLGQCLCETKDVLMERMIGVLNGNRDLGQKDLIKNFYTYTDKNNCDRIYHVIMEVSD